MGVYVDEAPFSADKNGKARRTKSGSAKLVSFSRSILRVKLETAGAFVVSVVDSNGDVIRSFIRAK